MDKSNVDIDFRSGNYHKLIIDKYNNNFPGISDIRQVFRADNQFLLFYEIESHRIKLLTGDAYSIFGIKSRDISLEEFLEEIHPNDRDSFINSALEIFDMFKGESRESKEVKINFRNKEGKHLLMKLKACNCFRDEQNHISRLLILANVNTAIIDYGYVG